VALVLVLFTAAPLSSQSGPCKAPARHDAQCVPFLTIEWVRSPDTADVSSDTVILCESGKITAVHKFTAPPLGNSSATPVTWSYSGQLGQEALSDVRRVFRRADITRLGNGAVVNVERAAAYPGSTTFRDTMTFSLPAEQRRIVLRGFLYLSCDARNEQMPQTTKDLICLFGNLYSQAKSRVVAEECSCKSLHKLAAQPNQ